MMNPLEGAPILGEPNQKGGVRKTTNVVHHAVVLATVYDKRVLAVDMDPQGNLTSLLAKPEDLPLLYEKTISYALENNKPLPIIESRIPGIWLCPSTIKLSSTEGFLRGGEGAEYKLKEALEPLRHQFDFILPDTAPSLGILLVNVLTACNGIVIPISHLGFETDGLVDLMKTIHTTKKYYNPNLQILGVLQTMSDSSAACTQFREELKKQYGDRLFLTAIPVNKQMPQAIKKHRTIFEWECRADWVDPVKNAYINFVDELLIKLNTDHGNNS